LAAKVGNTRRVANRRCEDRDATQLGASPKRLREGEAGVDGGVVGEGWRQLAVCCPDRAKLGAQRLGGLIGCVVPATQRAEISLQLPRAEGFVGLFERAGQVEYPGGTRKMIGAGLQPAGPGPSRWPWNPSSRAGG